MSETADVWYIRFPDGRVLRAANSTVVRQQLSNGRIPSGSLVRRTQVEEWVAPEEAPALSGAVRSVARSEPSTVASRVDPAQLRLLGVRSLLEDLLAALDSALVRQKLLVAALASLALGALLALGRYSFLPWLPEAWGWALGALGILVFAALSTLLSRFTYVELSQMRPARWGEGLQSLRAFTARLAVAQGGAGALLAAFILVLRELPVWLRFGAEEQPWATLEQVLGHAAVVLGMGLELVLWPLAALLFLLAPIVVVERCGVGSALRQWLALARRDFWKLLFCEALALSIGALVTLPFALPLFVLHLREPEARYAETARVVRDVVAGLTLTPVLAYLVVANVFVYLHLRYELAGRR